MAALAWLTGGGLPVFLGLTVILFGGFAFMMGQALAGGWRQRWQIWPYAVLLALAARFFAYALFHQGLLDPVAFLVALAVMVLLARLAYGLTRAAKMVRQYPWIYERAGPLGWRERRPQA